MLLTFSYKVGLSDHQVLGFISVYKFRFSLVNTVKHYIFSGYLILAQEWQRRQKAQKYKSANIICRALSRLR